MFKSLLAIVAVFALCTAPAKAQTLSDGEIVAIYDQVNGFDIETALLGAARAKSPSVRALAAAVARDHIGVRNAASALARKAGIAPMLPSERFAAASDHDALMEDLLARSGADFDRAYISNELAFHHPQSRPCSPCCSRKRTMRRCRRISATCFRTSSTILPRPSVSLANWD